MLNFNKYLAVKLVFSLMFIVLFQSCSDDLEQVNPNALTTESYWTNTNDLNSGLTATYSAIKDNDVTGIFYESTRTDISIPWTFRWKLLNTELSAQTFDQTTKQVIDRWNALYSGVFRANQVIDNYYRLEPTFVTGDTKDNAVLILAQARALRGYFYYELHSSYNKGSVPILETTPSSEEDFHPEFSPANAVRDFYRADLEFGFENLPATNGLWEDEDGNNQGRISGGACEALLAKSYLNENDFTTAEIRLNNVINNYGYTLVSDLSEVFTAINEFNTETIFEINFTNQVNLINTGEESVASNLAGHLARGNGQIHPSSWLTTKYKKEKGDPLDPANMNMGATVYDSNGIPEVDEDSNPVTVDRLRKYSWRLANSIGTVDDIDTPIYGVTAAEFGNERTATPFNNNGPNRYKKFTNWNTILDGSGEIKEQDDPNYNKSPINIPIIRLGEIYLMYAECMLEKGDLSEALRYINRIRKRSHLILLGKSSEASAEYNNAETTYMDDIDFDASNGEQTVTTENLMEHLRFTERPVELALEGSRVVNLRRWGVFKEQLVHIASLEYDQYTYKKNQNGKHNHRWSSFLIPTGEIPDFNWQGKPKINKVNLKDALVGSANYQEDIHGYYPVPIDEINFNLNWNNNN